DENVFKNLSNGKTLGIFQLESPGMTNLIKKIKPKNIEDISITSALFRPGPQKLIVEFLKNREEPKSIEYFDEMFEKILKPTSGIIIYQEQLIDIIKKITSFSVGEADIFRRIISKKDSSKLSLVEENFKEKAKKNGYKAEYIEKIFNYIKQFASYGFNHAHSIAYAYISYWMAYLKCKYPMEFFTEILSSNDGNNEKISEYINEAKEYDISFLQPSINNSNFNFEIFDNKILFGFSVVKGIGYETIKKLLSTRRSFGKKFTNWLETIAFLSKNGISVKTIELLIKIGAFDEILNDKTRSFLLKNINEIYSKSKTTLKTGEMLIKPNLIQINETEEMKKSLHEEQNLLLGFSFLEHPIIKVKNDKKINNFHKIIELRNLKENNKLKLFVLINNVREIKTKNGFLMASIKFEDETGSNNAIVFPNIYKKISDFLLQNKYFIATICKKNNELQLIDLEIN
ncbi:MAG: hypothetical protein LBD05_00480, partial [Mycoplasmataceae bacterium]|nr:hypothetical protein [Mycoplasmataceae bacterium]